MIRINTRRLTLRDTHGWLHQGKIVSSYDQGFLHCSVKMISLVGKNGLLWMPTSQASSKSRTLKRRSSGICEGNTRACTVGGYGREGDISCDIFCDPVSVWRKGCCRRILLQCPMLVVSLACYFVPLYPLVQIAPTRNWWYILKLEGACQVIWIQWARSVFNVQLSSNGHINKKDTACCVALSGSIRHITGSGMPKKVFRHFQ